MTAPQQLPLIDIHLPNQISLWPPAYGWWILTAMGLLTLYYAIRAIKNRHRARVQKNIALRQLTAIDLQHPGAWQQINETLKRAAMVYYSREQVAALSGEKWKQFLLWTLKKDQAAAFDDSWLHFAYTVTTQAVKTQQISDYHQFARLWLSQALPPRRHTRAAKAHPLESSQNV